MSASALPGVLSAVAVTSDSGGVCVRCGGYNENDASNIYLLICPLCCNCCHLCQLSSLGMTFSERGYGNFAVALHKFAVTVALTAFKKAKLRSELS